MAVVIRRPGITHEEYVNYIKHIHGYKITCSNPLAIKKYVQNYVYDGVFGSNYDNKNWTYQICYHADSVTELYFENKEEMAKTFSSDYVKNVVGPDGINFSDMKKSISALVQEEEWEVKNPSEGGFKVFYFLKKSDAMNKEDFAKAWKDSHKKIMDNNEILSKKIRKFINNIPIEGSETDYFGGDKITYDGEFFNPSKSFVIFGDYLVFI